MFLILDFLFEMWIYRGVYVVNTSIQYMWVIHVQCGLVDGWICNPESDLLPIWGIGVKV